MSRPQDQHLDELVKVICLVGLLLAMIALLPEFDGRRSADWGKQEDDDEQRG
jgi:hypothetical protein